jgi:hypothetical protein
MKMEKKILTNLAMMTFLMSSTAVMAMEAEKESDPKVGIPAQQEVVVNDKKEETVAPVVAAMPEEKKGWFSFFFGSTPTLTPVEEETAPAAPKTEDEADLLTKSVFIKNVDPEGFKKMMAAIQSQKPEDLAEAQKILDSIKGKGPDPIVETPVVDEVPTEPEEKTYTPPSSPVSQSEENGEYQAMLLSASKLGGEQLQQILEAGESEDPAKVQEAAKLLQNADDSKPEATNTLSPEQEGMFRRLWNKLWGASPSPDSKITLDQEKTIPETAPLLEAAAEEAKTEVPKENKE